MQRTIQTFEQLYAYARAFADGKLNLLVVVGEPGLSKSQTVWRALEDANATYRKFVGSVSAYMLYRELYWHRGELIVIDDVDDIWRERESRRILKALCQTDAIKEMEWSKANTVGIAKRKKVKASDDEDYEDEDDGLEDDEHADDTVPNRYTTTSRTCIIANDLGSFDANMRAIIDRGTLIRFKPTAAYIHAKAKEFFKDQEILDYVEQWLPMVKSPSLRQYVTALELKTAGLPWKEALQETWDIPDEILAVHRLVHDKTLTDRERVQRYTAETGRSRADYFRQLQRVRSL